MNDGRFNAVNARRKTEKHMREVREDLQKQIEQAESLDEVKAAMLRLVGALRILTQ